MWSKNARSFCKSLLLQTLARTTKCRSINSEFRKLYNFYKPLRLYIVSLCTLVWLITFSRPLPFIVKVISVLTRSRIAFPFFSRLLMSGHASDLFSLQFRRTVFLVSAFWSVIDWSSFSSLCGERAHVRYIGHPTKGKERKGALYIEKEAKKPQHSLYLEDF